jgi:hypothetical protein
MNPRKKRTSLWKWLAMVMAGLSLVAVFACNSPYIPIPPPDPTYSQDSSGEWAVSIPPDYRAIGANYFIFNASVGTGIIQRAESDGSAYARPLQGKAGDSIYIHWERGTETSPTICRPLGVGLVQMVCQ